MTEEEKRKKIAGIKRKKARQRRQLRLLLAGAVIVLVVVGALLIRVLKTEPRGNGPQDGPQTADIGSLDNDVQEGKDQNGMDQNSKDLNGNGSGAEDNSQVTPIEKLLTFSPESAHVGDLILVNGNLSYDFEANAATADIVNIRDNQSFYYQVHKLEMSVDRRILGPLDALIKACHNALGNEEAGIESAYRSLDYQQNVWNQMAEDYGDDYAQKYVAVPGYSEHHTGLSVDIGLFYPNGSEGSFSESKSAVWMDNNSWRYGFVRRYASDKVDVTGISNEAWHFRYVGIPHAQYMKENNLALEEYIDYLRQKTNMSHPLTVETEDGTYRIFMTADNQIPSPSGSYTVSGSNSGEWIITEKMP